MECTWCREILETSRCFDRSKGKGRCSCCTSGCTYYDQITSKITLINNTLTLQVHHNVFASKTITPPESILPERLVSILKDPDTFVIFGGGSFSFRKGHDLIIDAMSSLVKMKSSKRIVLVTAWVNLLAETRPNLRDQIRRVFPGLESTRPDDMSKWLSETKGIPIQNHYTLGLSSHTEIATVLQHADAALFTNRAEGGTNLPAMEAMASGLAVILSANTGHLDLIRLGDEEKDLNGKPDKVEKWWMKSVMRSPDHCVALQKQSEVKVVHHWQVGADESHDWGESDVNEIVSAVRDLIEHPNRAKELGRNAAKKMSRFTWTRTALRIHRVLAKELGLESVDVRIESKGVMDGWGRAGSKKDVEMEKNLNLKDVVDRAVSLLNGGDHENAEAWFRKAIEMLDLKRLVSQRSSASSQSLDNAVTVLRTIAMYIYEPQGRLSEAEQNFRTILQLRPRNLDALNGLGRVLGPQGLISEARDTLERAIELDSKYADAHFHLTNVLLMQQEWRLALDHARKGHEICVQTKDDRLQSFEALLIRAEESFELYAAA